MAWDYTNFLEVDADVEADFRFTDRAGVVQPAGSGLYPRNFPGDWCLETTGSTTSSNTGPTANPAGRSAYVYTESSSSVLSTAWAMKRNDSFNTIADTLFIDILHNLHTQTASEYYMEYATVASPNETTDWTILETVQCTDVDAWVSKTFDFTGISSATLWVRIRFSSTNSFLNDLAFSTWREYSVSTIIQSQEGFRFRNDDGSESAATWKAGQDTNIVIDQNEKARVRFILDTTAGTGDVLGTLQYKRKDEPTSEWRNI